MTPPDDLLTVKEVSLILGISQAQVSYLVTRGSLHVRADERVGKRGRGYRRFLRSEIEQYMQTPPPMPLVRSPGAPLRRAVEENGFAFCDVPFSLYDWAMLAHAEVLFFAALPDDFFFVKLFLRDYKVKSIVCMRVVHRHFWIVVPFPWPDFARTAFRPFALACKKKEEGKMTPEQEKRFDEFLNDKFGTGEKPSELEQLFSEPPLNRLGKRAINEFLDKLASAKDWKAKQELVRRFIVDIASQFEASDLLPWNEMSIAIKLHQKLIAKQGADNQSLQEQIEQLRGEITGMAAQLNALELTVADMFPENSQEERVGF